MPDTTNPVRRCVVCGGKLERSVMNETRTTLQSIDALRGYLETLTPRDLAIKLVTYALETLPTTEWALVIGSAVSTVLEERTAQDARGQMP